MAIGQIVVGVGFILLIVIIVWLIIRKVRKRRRKKLGTTEQMEKVLREFEDAEQRYKDSNYKADPQQILWNIAKENMKGGAEYGERFNGTGKPEAETGFGRIRTERDIDKRDSIQERSLGEISDERTGDTETEGRDKPDRRRFKPVA